MMFRNIQNIHYSSEVQTGDVVSRGTFNSLSGTVARWRPCEEEREENCRHSV